MVKKGFNSEMPIYLQIMTLLRSEIVSGEWKPGNQIPSVRELAETLRVNPNTMQRALYELEREGLLCSERTSGRYVTDDEEKISQTKKEMANEIIENCIAYLTHLGYTKEEIRRSFDGKGNID